MWGLTWGRYSRLRRLNAETIIPEEVQRETIESAGARSEWVRLDAQRRHETYKNGNAHTHRALI